MPIGTEGPDSLNGTGGPDLLQGFGGDDGLLGLAGNDTLQGDDGNDTFQGASGNDRLDGGNGNDRFDEGPWDFGNDLTLGGAGDDTFLGANGRDTLNGGAGNDLFIIEYQKTDVVLATAGAGQDEFRFGHMASLLQPSPGAAQYVVTDFSVADDRIDLDGLLVKSSEVGAYEGGNPFGTGGVLRWLFDAATGDSRLQSDVDGAGSSRTWQTVITLRDVDWHDLTAANFVGGVNPGGGSVSGQNLSGTSNPDSIAGGFFNDTISGGEGDDTLLGSSGDDVIDGGGGNDLIVGGPGKDTLAGGAGDDTFDVSSANQGAVATGGTGRDVYVVATTPFDSSRNYKVTDFDTGPEGDLIDVDELINQSASPHSSDDYHFEGGNPFDPEAPFLKFVQSGAHLVLQWDRDGPDGTDHAWRNVLTLLNTQKSEITASHIVHGLPLDGSAPDGLAATGTESAETLEGGYGDDTLEALGGGDYVIAYLGDDSINAGGGDDTIDGGLGNDTMHGGDGDDRFGPSGVDMQYAAKMLGDDEIHGGAGQDFLDDNYGDNLLDGGDGDDFLSAHAGDFGATTLVGGAGRDNILLFGDAINSGFRMADFAAGAGGDLFEVDVLLGKSIGLDEGNPFSLGYLKFVAVGTDTLLRWDRDGAAGTQYTLKTQLRLVGIAPGEITSDNFVGQHVIGTSGNDDLFAGLGNDTVEAFAGNDTLDGSLGADTLEGGAGDDLYFVDHVDDECVETSNLAGALLLPGEPGSGPALAGVAGITDTVIAAVNYSLASFEFVENLTLTGSARQATGNVLANVIKGNSRANTLTGGDGNDRLDGSSGNDTLDGGGHNDRLVGGTGNDVLIWGAGDRFDGGAGTDTLKITTGNVDLPDGLIKNVEIIDLRGGESSTLTITKADVLAISPIDMLRVLGDAGDAIDTSGFTASGGPVNGFQTYRSGTATLLVHTDINVS
jgi:Ca2+-binding RTX toxin-like protein